MEQVRHRVENAVGIIELSNPPHQFMTQQMVGELDALTEAWARDPRVRAIVISGTDPGTFITHFSVEELAQAPSAGPEKAMAPSMMAVVDALLRGLDRGQRVLEHFPGLRKSVEEAVFKTRFGTLVGLAQVHRVFSRLEQMDKAVVAAINGTAMGAGCELALACDYRLMARGDNVIGLIEVLGAIIPGAGGTQRLARAVGPVKAVEMLLDGVLVGPDEAARIGLVTRAVDADVLMDEAMELARRLTTRSLGAVGHAKRAVRLGSRLPLEEGLAFERLAFVLAAASPDSQKVGRYYLESFFGGMSARAIFDTLRAGKGPSFEEARPDE